MKWSEITEAAAFYHGTDHHFDAFVVPREGKNGDLFGSAIYVTDDRSYAARFGNHILEVEVSDALKIVDDRDIPQQHRYGPAAKRWAIARGYNAVRGRAGRGSEVAIYDPRQIVSIKRPTKNAVTNEMRWTEISEAAEASEHGGLPSGVVDVKGNWRRFDELPPDAQILLYHATSAKAAAAIMAAGFRQNSKVWANTVNGFVYLGGTPRSIEMYGLYASQKVGGKHAILQVITRKGDLLPDDGPDWKHHLRSKSNKQFAVQWFGKESVRTPSVTATFACIGQVRAPLHTVKPVSVLNPDDLGWG